MELLFGNIDICNSGLMNNGVWNITKLKFVIYVFKPIPDWDLGIFFLFVNLKVHKVISKALVKYLPAMRPFSSIFG